MEIEEAIECIRSLANGINPETKQPIEENSACRQPLAIKALNRALASLVAQQQRSQKRPSNSGRSWSPAEDAQICEALRNGTDLHEIAKTHSRSIAAILARLVKLGKIAPEKAGELFPTKVA
jgi:antitoxin (DNA-binding transcriptional repressor) of toxin-antitoxin stability system